MTHKVPSKPICETQGAGQSYALIQVLSGYALGMGPSNARTKSASDLWPELRTQLFATYDLQNQWPWTFLYDTYDLQDQGP